MSKVKPKKWYDLTCSESRKRLERVKENGEWEILEILGRHDAAYERKKVYE